jgi:hypothetical protein
MARNAERLKVGPVEPSTAVFERHDVVYDPGCNYPPNGLTLGTHGIFSQHLGSDQPPVS